MIAAAVILGSLSTPLMAEAPARLAMRGEHEQATGSAGSAGSAGSGERWYSEAQVARGAEVYVSNCAACHGSRAQGGSAGGLAAPPLDGSGHSTHHGLDYLLGQVAEGGVPRGGSMPPFAGVLDEAERRAAIAWVQSLWPEAVYRDWQRSQGHHH